MKFLWAITLFMLIAVNSATGNSSKDSDPENNPQTIACNNSLGSKSSTEAGRKLYSSTLSEIVGNRNLVVEKSEQVFLEDALSDPKRMFVKLSFLPGRSRPGTALQTAFFIRLFEPENSSHIDQLMRYLPAARREGIKTDLSGKEFFAKILQRIKTSFDNANSQHLLEGTSLKTAEDFIALILSHGYINFPSPALAITTAAFTHTTEGSLTFDTRRILNSPFLLTAPGQPSVEGVQATTNHIRTTTNTILSVLKARKLPAFAKKVLNEEEPRANSLTGPVKKSVSSTETPLKNKSENIAETKVGEGLFALMLWAISGKQHSSMVWSDEVFLKNALSISRSTISKLSILPIRSKKRVAFQTAFFARLFEPRNPSHITQVMAYLLPSIQSGARVDMAEDEVISAALLRAKSGFTQAHAQGYLQGIEMGTAEDFIASLLSHASKRYPRLTLSIARVVSTLERQGAPAFSIQNILGSSFFELSDLATEDSLESQRTLAKNFEPELPLAKNPRALTNYKLAMNNSNFPLSKTTGALEHEKTNPPQQAIPNLSEEAPILEQDLSTFAVQETAVLAPKIQRVTTRKNDFLNMPLPLAQRKFLKRTLTDPVSPSLIESVMESFSPSLGGLENDLPLLEEFIAARLTALREYFFKMPTRGLKTSPPAIQSAEDFLASLLTFASAKYPELTRRIAYVAVNSFTAGVPLYNVQNVLSSPFFEPLDGTSSSFSEAQWVIAKKLEARQLPLVYDHKVLSNYWQVMTNTPFELDGKKVALTALREALPAQELAAAQAKSSKARRPLTKEIRIFRAIADLAEIDKDFYLEIRKYVPMPKEFDQRLKNLK